ncbi:MAG: alpha/beta fold hydrolase [Promethearchaeota archaeon]
MVISDDKSSQIVELTDGRRLGYAEYGDPRGRPIFYFHGNYGSRLEALFGKENYLVEKGIRFVCMDRPGLGLSDYQAKRLLLDWPIDVLELATHLNIDKFAVMGGSGGGPYALACTHEIPPNRLTGCLIVSGLGPYSLSKEGMNRRSKNMLVFARRFPWAFRFALWIMMGRKAKQENVKWWEENYQKLYQSLPEPDQKLVLEPSIRERMILKTLEAFRQGSKGPAHDFKLYTKPWGFELHEIPEELTVFLFHGGLDTSVPISMARTMSEQIPNCKTKFYPEEGHLSVLINRFDEIFSSL